MKKQLMQKTTAQAILLFAASLFLSGQCSAFGPKSAAISGNWSNLSTWGSTSTPSASDTVVIPTGVTITMDCNASVKSLTVSSGGTLNLSNSYTLTLNGSLTVNGTLVMNGGNITQNYNTALFVIGNTGYFEWEPGTNTLPGATLFSRSVENFATTSTLKIKTWYDYANVPLGSVVSGNFGNLIMNSLSGSSIYEWNQNNQFQSHQILGTLTIDQGWITLDKSGSISNTTINNIALLSANSTLYMHRGTHPGSFTVNTNSISNSNGTFVGLHNGNGNVTVNVGGNVTTSGNFKLINNDGVLNVSNGNGTLNITGTYSQTGGDTRLIYNISTTNSGFYNFNAGDIQFNGGIFMGQYGCHTSAQAATVSVTNNINMSFVSSGDIFRFNGLTSLSGTMNTLKLNLSVGGNFIITSNNNGAEFTSASAAGLETITVNGNMSVGGGKISFNYGFPTAAHDVVFTLGGSMTVSGGVFNLSKHLGTGTYNINGAFNMTGGTVAVKGDDGGCTVNFNSSFTQSGGIFYIHYNNNKISTAPSKVIVNGAFTHSGGTFNFDDNTSNNSDMDELVIKGPSYNLTGNGVMTHAGAGTCTVFGLIRFERSGTITFNRTASGHSVTQVKQLVSKGTTLDVYTGNVQLASHNTASLDFLTVQENATLKLRAGQIYSNATYPNSGFTAENNATISTMNLFGFYDGTAFTAVKSTGNMNYYLHSGSTVEYNGWSNQIITGTGAGVATTDNHKYGILKINFNGTPGVNYLYPTASNVFVRNQLQLLNGNIVTGNYEINVTNPSSSSVNQHSALSYVVGNLRRSVGGTNAYDFPLGTMNNYELINIYLYYSSGISNILGSYTNTNPNLQASNLANAIVDGLSIAEMLDHGYWSLTPDAGLTNGNYVVTLKGTGHTNPAPDPATYCVLKRHDINNNWDFMGYIPTAPTESGGVATVVCSGLTTFSDYVIAKTTSAVSLPISLVDFTATPAKNSVLLSWATNMEVNNDFFTLEKSKDGNKFTALTSVKGAGNSTSTKTYRYTDDDVTEGILYYRLSQTDFDGTTVKHKVVMVNMGNVYFDNAISVESIYPNPFNDRFTVLINSTISTQVEVTLTDMNGKVIQNESLGIEKGRNNYVYKGKENLPEGIYFINITASGKAITRKIVKG